MLCSLVDSRQDDKDIVLAAVKQNPAALQFASSSLRYDKANGKQAAGNSRLDVTRARHGAASDN